MNRFFSFKINELRKRSGFRGSSLLHKILLFPLKCLCDPKPFLRMLKLSNSLFRQQPIAEHHWNETLRVKQDGSVPQSRCWPARKHRKKVFSSRRTARMKKQENYLLQSRFLNNPLSYPFLFSSHPLFSGRKGLGWPDIWSIKKMLALFRRRCETEKDVCSVTGLLEMLIQRINKSWI